jgi:hypothetical protein
VESNAVIGIDGHELDVLVHVAPREREELFEHERRGDDGRPAVERKTCVAIDGRATAGLVALFDQRHAEAACL